MSSLTAATLQSLLSAAQEEEAFLAHNLNLKKISIIALENVLARAFISAEALEAELADKRKTIAEMEAALQAQAKTAPVMPEAATTLPARVDWKKQTLSLASNADIIRITEEIESGVLASKTKTVNWHDKHHPGSLFPSKIIYAISNTPNRILSFSDLAKEVGGDIPLSGNGSLQNYLRELVKQGIVLLA